jgi:hypothetical protein
METTASSGVDSRAVAVLAWLCAFLWCAFVMDRHSAPVVYQTAFGAAAVAFLVAFWRRPQVLTYGSLAVFIVACFF